MTSYPTGERGKPSSVNELGFAAADAVPDRAVKPPVVCWPWHLWRLAADDGHPTGANCALCRLDVAVPRVEQHRKPICLYCAIDTGLRSGEPRPFPDNGRTAAL